MSLIELCGYIRRMPQRNILIVAVDGLRASALGAYGNTSFGTPAFDKFAAESFAFDWWYSPGAELREAYRALWYSQHPLRLEAAAAGRERAEASLPSMFAERSYRTILVADEPELTKVAGAAEFDEFLDVTAAGGADGTQARASDVAETHFARLFATASDVVLRATGDAPRMVLWVHSCGMYGPWDAPLELQELLRDEGDPPALESVLPPDLMLADADDPDAVFQYGAAYAGQVMALDACWKGLMAAVEQAGNETWRVMLLGVRGYPMGEHGRIGGIDGKLYVEQLHVPAIVQFPDGLGRLARNGSLASHLDVFPTLDQWTQQPAAAANDAQFDGMSVLPLATTARAAWRDALVFGSSAGSRAIRTADWCLRQEMTAGEDRAESDSAETKSELFVRPDDRWEANDVAKLCAEVVETLSDGIEDASRRIAGNEPLPNRIVPVDSPACGA